MIQGWHFWVYVWFAFRNFSRGTAILWWPSKKWRVGGLVCGWNTFCKYWSTKVIIPHGTGGDIWNIASKHMDIISTATWVFGNSCAFEPICQPCKLLPGLIHAFSLLRKINIWRWLHGQIPSLTEVIACDPIQDSSRNPNQNYAHNLSRPSVTSVLNGYHICPRGKTSDFWTQIPYPRDTTIAADGESQFVGPGCESQGEGIWNKPISNQSCRCNIQSGLEKQHITTWNFWSEL